MTKTLEAHIAELQGVIDGPGGKRWLYGPAVSALIAALEQSHKQCKEWSALSKRNIDERVKDISALNAAQARVAELEALCVKLPGGWVAMTDGKPDPNDNRRVCVFTPSEHDDLRYRFVPASLFKAVCSEATHWHYMTTPADIVQG